LHDSGCVHGSITPEKLGLTGSGVRLDVPKPGEAIPATPYTAPEVLAGCAADARADIFAFGAIVFEMLTGQRAFDGETREEVPCSGSSAVDRLVRPCLMINPDARTPRMQKAMLELKLLKMAAHRAAAAEAKKSQAERYEAFTERILAIVEQNFERLADRISAIEAAVESIKSVAHHFESSVAADLVDLEEGFKAQTAALDAAKTAMSQTDDLVERVVEALESLQSAVLDPREPGQRSNAAVN
jgi:serine/threonine protein kinase